MNRWRINIIFIFFILLSATVIGRLFYIQIIQGELYKALAYGQQKNLKVNKGERGTIFLGENRNLATNITGKFIYLVPKEIGEAKSQEVAKKLNEILNLDENWILEKTKKDNLFEMIKRRLTPEEEEKLKAFNLPGVYLGQEILRYYPYNSFASQVIGFLGGDEKGQYGIEGFYDGILTGEENKTTKRGSDISLVLDYNIQFTAEKLLEKGKEELDIEGGQIIVIEPESGKTLSMANFPYSDLNQYAKEESLEVFKNSVIQEIFEPGSVLKPITIAAALDQEKITPETTFLDKGFVEIGDDIIYNYSKRVWGQKSMTEVLEKSINTGAIFAERQLGNSLFLEYLKKFGFFEPTEIDLQGEVFSKNKEIQKGYEINFATASFGQGIEMTPIQLVRAFGVLANAGKLMKPYLVEKIFENGNVTEIQPVIQRENVISQKTAYQLTTMLVNVVENGFGKGAKIPGYYLAGKTGTAQVPWSALGINKKGYSEKTIQSFIGYAPAFNPKFLILVKLDNPKTKTAEYSAVPIFRDLAKYIIDLWQIPPDYE